MGFKLPDEKIGHYRLHKARNSLPSQKELGSGIKNTYDFIKNKVMTKRAILVQREENKHESLAGIVIKRDFRPREQSTALRHTRS